jgi:hypothetical protein
MTSRASKLEAELQQATYPPNFFFCITFEPWVE